MKYNVSNILLEELGILEKEIISNLERNRLVATGKTKQSLSHHLESPYRGVLIGASYLGVLEKGRGPAKKGGNNDRDFILNLKQWIIARQLDYGGDLKGLERLARFLKWYINKNGTWMFIKKQRQEIISLAVDKFTERLKKRLLNHLEAEVKNEIFEKE